MRRVIYMLMAFSLDTQGWGGYDRQAMSATEIHRKYTAGWACGNETPQALPENRSRPRGRPGACVWLTGLCGSGKTVTAEALTDALREQALPVTLLDGDAFRARHSQDLGFSKRDRDANVLRIGEAALDIVKAGGIAVCAVVSPYEETRRAVRDLIGEARFVSVFVNTPLEVCQWRDPKGLYAKALRGEIRNFTGIDDPYEAPEDPDVELETITRTPEDNAQIIVEKLARRGLLPKGLPIR